MSASASIPAISVSATCWVYGERRGLAVVQEERDSDGNHVRTLTCVVPWNVVEEAHAMRPGNKT